MITPAGAIRCLRGAPNLAQSPLPFLGRVATAPTLPGRFHHTARSPLTLSALSNGLLPSQATSRILRATFIPKFSSYSRSISFTSNRPAAGLSVSKLVPSSLQADANQRANLRQLFALAKPEKTVLLTAFGLLLISSSVTMSIPLTFGKLIDFFAHGAQPGTLPISVTPMTAGTVLLALFTIGAAANAGRVILMRSASARIVARLRNATYASALRQDVEFLERTAGPGDVVSRLNADAYIVGDSLTGNLSDGVRAVVTASIGLSLMFYLSPTLTALMLAIVPPVSLGAFAYGRYLKRLSHRTQAGLGDMTKIANEALSAIRTVQAFTAAPREETRFATKVNHVQDLAIKEARAAALFFGATGWSGNVVVLGLLAYGGSLVSRGQISVGDLTSLLMYTAYVGGSLSMLSSFFSSLMKGLGASERVFQLLQREPVIRTSSTAFDITRDYGNIEFKNVFFSYPSRPGAEILRGFSMKIMGKGDSVAIVGKSGSGKSSVQSLLFRFYDPDSGQILVNGKDVHEYTVESWRSAIGIVPQDPVLFTGTIAENIAYGYPLATRVDVEEAARLANCDFVWDMPDKFDTKIGRDSLSGGQRQRIAIARALIKKPALLCLDEATSALDALSELRVNEAIERILESQETSTLIVAHRLSTISRAGRIVVLEDGQVTEEGTFQGLVANPDSRFRVLMASQLDAL
ncbi:ABC multidrug transporter [Rhizoctonia solani AG-3 Rhs1AP]|uniref:ABC multidrug transporter n=2 Tax=Rhizoctonia solani AG-3 TaxID=1086053 RepID=A0A074S964_9AGAM|nr:ABC multidrug transporter [Rhizoctonia solani AG-3 Rhs1AP]KEP46577.1 ABC multidrug transporter [Rhizoctonia solani 123E]